MQGSCKNLRSYSNLMIISAYQDRVTDALNKLNDRSIVRYPIVQRCHNKNIDYTSTRTSPMYISL